MSSVVLHDPSLGFLGIVEFRVHENNAVEMISKIDLKRHHHFRAQMSIFHTIALCVEYLQERYGTHVIQSCSPPIR